MALVLVTAAGQSLAEDIDIYKSRMCSSGSAQDYRFIFVVDNSGSMSTGEFQQSKATVDASIEHVLEKLANVEVAVVQYGSDTGPAYDLGKATNHDYDVSVPFTSDPVSATNWNRVYGISGHFQDHTPGSLSKMRSDNVYGSGEALDITDADNVQFVFFTDASRDDSEWGCCSSIVADSLDYLSDTVYPGFGEYDALKSGAVLPGGLKAQFTVLNNNSDAATMAASAAIASAGGDYTGAVEQNATDPDGSGASPRRFVAGTLSAANDTSRILSLLDQVVEEIIVPPVSTSDTFTQASIDIDRASFASDDRAYFSLFAPSDARSWRGNVKGYFLGKSGLLDVQGVAATSVTADNEVAFKDSAQSFWSSSADGSDVLSGGVNEQIVSAPARNLYTYLGTEPVSGALQQRVEAANTNITSAMLNVGTEAQRTSTLDWLQSAPMGDSLHTRPVLVRYQGRSVLYVATNQGLLHAIDATHPATYGDTTGGDEIWGFIPQQLLPNLALHGGTPTAGEHLYGLDGGITRWHEDHNRDGIVNGSDELLLIFGQRRGGRSYFALDVTDPLTPRFKWQITGGKTSGFDDLMQTWSQPALITVAHSGYPARGQTAADAQRVLVFGGGYDDTVFDGASTAGISGGGALYMVDKDGSLLWRTENKMHYSIPADLAIIDSNDDFLADRIYAADLGGQIWRVDLADLSAIDGSNVMLLASAASDGYQPFFYPPSISYTYQDRKSMLAVTIGSGNRTDPLNATAQHYLYMFRDVNVEVGAPPSSTQSLSASSLYDITSFDLGSSTPSVRQNAQDSLDTADGWKLKLAPGEAVLAGVRVVEDVLQATTFRATYDGDPALCESSFKAESRLYSLLAANGNPAMDSDGNRRSSVHLLNAWDRSEVIPGNGIPSSPVTVFPQEGDSIQILVGREIVSELTNRLVRLYWHAK